MRGGRDTQVKKDSDYRLLKRGERGEVETLGLHRTGGNWTLMSGREISL